MTNPETNPNPKRIGNLIIKYLSGELTIEESLELSEWVSQSAANKELFEKFTQGKIKLSEDTFNEDTHQKSIQTLLQDKTYKRKTNKYQPILITISILLFLGTIFTLLIQSKRNMIKVDPLTQTSICKPNGTILTLSNGSKVNLDSIGHAIKQNNAIIKTSANTITYIPTSVTSEKPEYNCINTKFGKTTLVILSDGSRIWLNAASAIRYPTAFTQTVRKIDISGEAYFEIASQIDTTLPEKKIPFIICLRGMEINVKGTHFNVSAYQNEEIKVALTEGIIEIKKGNGYYQLKPGQQFHINNKDKINITGFNEDEVLAWKKGRFVYNETDLVTVMKDISKWYNVDVIFKDVIFDHFTTSVKREISLEQFLKILEVSTYSHYKLQNNTIIISK